jgi:hypothetical protein
MVCVPVFCRLCPATNNHKGLPLQERDKTLHEWNHCSTSVDCIIQGVGVGGTIQASFGHNLPSFAIYVTRYGSF